MRPFYLLPLLLSTACASNLFRRDAGLDEANCVQCPVAPEPCGACDSDQLCVLVTRTCTSCASNQCQPIASLASPQIQKPDTPVANNSSASYLIVSVCGAGVAMLLATGLFVVYQRRRRMLALAAAAASSSSGETDSGLHHLQSISSAEHPLKYAIGSKKPSATTATQRGVSAVSSVEWDIGSRQASMAFHEDLMLKSSFDSVNRANTELQRYTLSGAAPLLPKPAPTSDGLLTEFLSEIDIDDDEPLVSATTPTHHRSLSISSLNGFKFPAAPSAATRRTPPSAGMPGIPETTYHRDSVSSQASSASSASAASLHSIAKVNIARVEPMVARSTLVMPQRSMGGSNVGGNFTSMRSSNEFGTLNDSRDKLSAVGSGSFSRVASTIASAAAGHRQTMSLSGKWQAPLGRADAYQKLFGKTPDTNLVMNREKTEREKRRDSMVREAMKRASVEHVKLNRSGSV